MKKRHLIPLAILSLLLLMSVISVKHFANGDNGAPGDTTRNSRIPKPKPLTGDDYGSLSFYEDLGLPSNASEGAAQYIKINDITINLREEVAANRIAHFYFPQINTPYPLDVSGASKTITIPKGAGDTYRKVRSRAFKIDANTVNYFPDENRASLRDGWRLHLWGNYYYQKAKEKHKTGTLSFPLDEKLLFPAIEKYKAAILKDPAFPMPHLYLGYIYYTLSENDVTNSAAWMEKAAHECKLAEKYNLSTVPLGAGEFTDTFGIIDLISDLKGKVGNAAYQRTSATFNKMNYDPKFREIKPESLREENLEIFVESVKKYLPKEERAKLYQNLGYYYHQKGAHHLALENYKKALETSQIRASNDEATFYKNISVTYKKLDWLEADEIALAMESPFER